MRNPQMYVSGAASAGGGAQLRGQFVERGLGIVRRGVDFEGRKAFFQGDRLMVILLPVDELVAAPSTYGGPALRTGSLRHEPGGQQ